MWHKMRGKWRNRNNNLSHRECARMALGIGAWLLHLHGYPLWSDQISTNSIFSAEHTRAHCASCSTSLFLVWSRNLVQHFGAHVHCLLSGSSVNSAHISSFSPFPFLLAHIYGNTHWYVFLVTCQCGHTSLLIVGLKVMTINSAHTLSTLAWTLF
jgi:hypothetical protein